MNAGLSELGRFFGDFHPVLVHLPIGFLVLLAVLELAALSPRYRTAASASGIILTITLPTTLVTAGCGWLLSRNDGYEADLLEWHEWTGFGVAAAVVCLFLAHRTGRITLYRVFLGVTLVLVTLAGHAGGTLTHGQGFLLRHAPWRPAPDPNAKAGNTPPVFQKYCVGCHGPEKAKADLRLDARELVLDSDIAAKVLQRLRLPIGHEDHMPPAGKPQPSPAEVEKVVEWIGSRK
jgi:uncharacterized membrane protein